MDARNYDDNPNAVENQPTPHKITGQLTHNGKSYQYLFFHQFQFLVLVFKKGFKMGIAFGFPYISHL
jgi:hypothetical protein